MSKSIKNMLQTASGRKIFEDRFPEFKRIIESLYRDKIYNKRKIIALGGAESISGVFSILDKSILGTIVAKKIKFLYVPIGVFGSSETVNTVDDYALLVKKYYQNLGFKIDFDYVNPRTSEVVIVSKFKKAHIIYLAGGDVKYLIERLSSPNVLRTLKNVYSKGTILIGNSAGILCLLKNPVSFSYGAEPAYIQGLNILKDYCILVHFSTDKNKRIKEISKHFGLDKNNIITLSESDAAIFLNEKFIATTERKSVPYANGAL